MHTKCDMLSKYPISTENEMPFYNKEIHPLLMKCFQTFVRYMRKMEGGYLYILLPLMALNNLCSTKRLTTKLQLHKIPDVGYTLTVPKWLVILKGETSIAYEVLQNHPEMHETGGRRS